MSEAFNNRKELKDYRRAHRNEPTHAEVEMWHGLRSRRAGGYKFRRQHSLGPFIVDFYCLELQLAIEVDGATHEEPEKQEYDRRRTEYLNANGIEVLRLTDGEALWSVDQCVARILSRIEAICASGGQPPNPP